MWRSSVLPLHRGVPLLQFANLHPLRGNRTAPAAVVPKLCERLGCPLLQLREVLPSSDNLVPEGDSILMQICMRRSSHVFNNFIRMHFCITYSITVVGILYNLCG